ncbi:hypothetical protein KL86DPRO_60101 [uncultured delta proteobacterium]|uniref:Uncharacterized protein n=1 Tax=uncultured delta proteobacterium TaxID=34034 RepID=A0A212KEV3_9DELT|nr:hypothetical protein KL86DPRO_60101 [uncultured delta proteobacterium]
MQDFTQHPNFDRQIALEKEMVTRGADAFRRKVADARADKLEANTAHGSYLVRRAIAAVAEGVREFLAKAAKGTPGRKHLAAKYLRQVEPEVAAFLGLRSCLNFVSARITLQNAAILLATTLETEVRLARFEEVDPRPAGPNPHTTGDRVVSPARTPAQDC